jgi:protein subunit release factor B
MNKKRRLLFSTTLKDCKIQHFCTGGPGGSNQNKKMMGARVIHEESGAVGECREHRTQKDNTREAFVRMSKTKKYQDWAKVKAAKILGQSSIEDKVNEQMQEHYIKVEIKKDEKWCAAVPEDFIDVTNYPLRGINE